MSVSVSMVKYSYKTRSEVHSSATAGEVGGRMGLKVHSSASRGAKQ